MGMAAAKAKASPKKATAKATPKKKVGPDGPVSARQILILFRSGAPPRAHHKLVGRVRSGANWGAHSPPLWPTEAPKEISVVDWFRSRPRGEPRDRTASLLLQATL